MIIGVNARFLTKPYTGIGQYTRYVFGELARQNPGDRFIFVVPEEVQGDFPANVEIVVLRERLLGTRGMKKTHWEQIKLPRFFKKAGVDVVHYPYPSNPWRDFSKPAVVTVHDTIPWTMAAYRRSFLTRLYQDRARNAVKHATKVVTVSETSKKDIVKACGVNADDVVVVHNAPPDHFFEKVDKAARIQILKKYGIPDSETFFLYVGGYDERKNVEHLVKSFAVGVADKQKVNLVLAGGKSLHGRLYKSFDALHDHSDKAESRVHTTGFVDEADMPALYQSAYGFVNLSMAEGFNLTLVEAAVSGTPMVVSNIPVHHEVIGDMAIYVDGKDEKGLTDALNRLIDDREFFDSWKARLAAYECPFSLEESAKALKALYTKL